MKISKNGNLSKTYQGQYVADKATLESIEKHLNAKTGNPHKVTANDTGAYTRDEVDGIVSGKADKDTVYTKTETDNRISGIIVQVTGDDATKVMSQKFLTELLINMFEGFDYNIGELENKIQTGLNGKADKNDVYTKSEVYTKDEIFTYVNGEVGSMGMGFYERFNQIDAQIGDIESALDELHNYATSLIGGEA